MGNVLTASSRYISVVQFPTNDQIDFEFDQVRLMNEAQAAGRQELLSQLANTGTLAVAGGGRPGFAGLAPWGAAPAFWMGLSNFFAVSAFIIIPAMIFLLIFLYLSKSSAILKWVAYFVMFFWCAELLLYYSGFGRRYIATSRNFAWSFLASLILSVVMVLVV
jgi:hypothetical protein